MIRELAKRSLDRAVARVRSMVPAPLWERIATPYREFRYRRGARHSWLTREDADDGHVTMYWANLDHPNRNCLTDTLVDLVEKTDRSRSLRMLEFGCHAGMNFRRLQDRLGERSISYFGVEPNHDACEFLRQKLPFVQVLEAEDRAFVDGSFPDGRVDIAFVNVVFYSVDAARTKRVIERLCAISDVVVLGEQLSNTSTTSQFQTDPEMYAHPYAHWLRACGFTQQSVIAGPEQSPQFSGFLIARRP